MVFRVEVSIHNIGTDRSAADGDVGEIPIYPAADTRSPAFTGGLHRSAGDGDVAAASRSAAADARAARSASRSAAADARAARSANSGHVAAIDGDGAAAAPVCTANARGTRAACGLDMAAVDGDRTCCGILQPAADTRHIICGRGDQLSHIAAGGLGPDGQAVRALHYDAVRDIEGRVVAQDQIDTTLHGNPAILPNAPPHGVPAAVQGYAFAVRQQFAYHRPLRVALRVHIADG